jgi:hypothetical protein
MPVLVQYVQVYQWIQAIQLMPDTDGTHHWHWSADGAYSSCSAYAALMLGQLTMLGARELWKTRAPNNCRFFVWLALLGRFWTAKRRHHHGLQASSSCILCYQKVNSSIIFWYSVFYAEKFGLKCYDIMDGMASLHRLITSSLRGELPRGSVYPTTIIKPSTLLW